MKNAWIVALLVAAALGCSSSPEPGPQANQPAHPGLAPKEQRINTLRACGWTVLRFAASDIYHYPDKVVALVRATLSLDPLSGRGDTSNHAVDVRV